MKKMFLAFILLISFSVYSNAQTTPTKAKKPASTAATTKPQRSATLHLLHLSFNAYGGIVRWVARPGEEISIVGNTASLGEASLSCLNAGTPGAMSAHILYELA